MGKYIDKDSLIAEIGRRKEKCDTFYNIALSNNAELAKVVIEELKRQHNSLLSFIDTLEVEELKEEHVSEELEEASQEYVTKEGYLAGLHYNSMVRSFKAGAEWADKHSIESKEVDLNDEIEKCLKKHSMLAVGKKDFTDIAKHFFELGLKAQKGE